MASKSVEMKAMIAKHNAGTSLLGSHFSESGQLVGTEKVFNTTMAYRDYMRDTMELQFPSILSVVMIQVVG